MKNEPYPRSTFWKQNAGSRKDRQADDRTSAITTQGVEKIVSDKLASDLTSKMIDFCIVFRD